MSTAWREVLARVRFEQVYCALGGPPLRRRRAIAFWRKGKRYSVSFVPETGEWFDHVQNHGGGIPQLVKAALGCDARAALQWLADIAGVMVKPFSKVESIGYRRQLARARSEAEELVCWRDELLDEVRLRRRDHWGAYHRALRVIEREGTATERGSLAGEVVYCAGREIERLNVEHDRLMRASWSELLPEFRRERVA